MSITSSKHKNNNELITIDLKNNCDTNPEKDGKRFLW